MRVRIEAAAGTLAANPERALEALADIAEADGADRDQWLEKATQSAVGATRRALVVSREPRFQAAEDAAQLALGAQRAILGRMIRAIESRLAQAIPDAAQAALALVQEVEHGIAENHSTGAGTGARGVAGERAP